MSIQPDAAMGVERSCSSGSRDQLHALARLRFQSYLAALMILAPCVLNMLFIVSIGYNQPAVVIGLLPGLVTAIYLVFNLFLNLPSNHRRREDDVLFPTLGAANWITLLRAAAIVALAGIVPLSFHSGLKQLTPDTLAWVSGIIYLCVAILDLLDGYVARKQDRITELGKHLDIATDAAGLLVVSLLAVALGRLPFIYLLVGLAYYPFAFGIWLRQRKSLPVVALQPRPYARIIAGFQMGLVAMALMPIFTPQYTFMVSYVFMTPLLIGFVRDWLVVSCRIETFGDQQTGFDIWVRSLLVPLLPFLLRLTIAICGIKILAGTSFPQAYLGWQVVMSFCCLLAAIGFMGRSAGLFLVLLLGSTQSPFGATGMSMTLFISAAALMLSGTGPMSSWAPEENILYRSAKKNTNTAGEAI